MDNINMVFDYIKLSRECNVDSAKLDNIIKEAKAEFTNDEMMMELHIIRAIRFYNTKHVSRTVKQ